MVDVQSFLMGAQNITSESDLMIYASKELFLPSIIFAYVVILVLMGGLGLAFIGKDKNNFLAIFIFSILVLGILLFSIFIFPVIPQFIDKIIGGKIWKEILILSVHL